MENSEERIENELLNDENTKKTLSEELEIIEQEIRDIQSQLAKQEIADFGISFAKFFLSFLNLPGGNMINDLRERLTERKRDSKAKKIEINDLTKKNEKRLRNQIERKIENLSVHENGLEKEIERLNQSKNDAKIEKNQLSNQKTNAEQEINSLNRQLRDEENKLNIYEQKERDILSNMKTKNSEIERLKNERMILDRQHQEIQTKFDGKKIKVENSNMEIKEITNDIRQIGNFIHIHNRNTNQNHYQN
ncbi:hypothetical protein BpHYR1_023945 [Brachionus plicatilis]|uniref:Uncharacterized protein n=1 Tax=Brachionus plicatilis TaxID=10195 RepID=A0A3M7SPM5_BRAPC|nr:hypothetical protein BpHYR1_023945 [Brachionus plicatilis]